MAKDDTKEQEVRGAFERAFDTAGFAEYDITNWGKVDGRNQWKHYDTLLVASLHYGSSTQDINAWLAIHDLEPDEESLSATDEVRAIRERRIATTIAQAIGRLRLRIMTKEDGSCDPCDIFVRLPNFKGIVDATKIMADVERTLPGIARVKWSRASTKLKRDGRAPKVRKDATARLLALADEVARDGRPRDLTMETLQTSNGSLGRVLLRAQDRRHRVAQELQAKGIVVVPGKTNGTPARLVRTGDTVPVALTVREQAVATVLGGLPKGQTKASTVREAAGVPTGSWAGLIAGKGIVQAMQKLGIAYQGGGRGAGRVAVFVRE
jgi:hypothetical protein